MLRITITFVLLLCAGEPARADWFYRFVGYRCDQVKDRLVVYNKGAYNEVGEAMRKAKEETEWEPDSLIASMKDDDHIGELKTIERTCRLTHGVYQIQIGPTPGNFNVQGSCGAQVTAWVEVWRGRKLVLPHWDLEGGCHDDSATVITEILFAKRTKPVFKRISREAFFR